MRPGYRYHRCKLCGGHESEVGTISRRAKCELCATSRVVMNDLELHEKRGPFYDHWRARCLAAFGVGIFEDRRSGV